MLQLGKHPLVHRIVKGVFQSRPSFPPIREDVGHKCCTEIFKNTTRLCYLRYKLVMLCTLFKGQRCQSLHLMGLHNMVKNQSSYSFAIDSLV